MTNPKYRLYLLIATAGLAFLIYHIADTFSDIDPDHDAYYAARTWYFYLRLVFTKYACIVQTKQQICYLNTKHRCQPG